MRLLLNSKQLLLSNQGKLLNLQRNFLSSIPNSYILTDSHYHCKTTECKQFPKLFPSTGNNVHRFCSSSQTKKFLNLKESDESGISIYEGKYSRNIVRVKLFSLGTSVMGLISQPVLWQHGQVVGGTGLGILLCSMVGIFTFVTPFLLHFVTKKYVVDIKYNKETDEYTCITISFFLYKNKVRIKNQQVLTHNFMLTLDIHFFFTH